MTDSFFSRLTLGTAEIHRQTLNHQMVLAIGAGTLAEETFCYYIEQDYQFLTRYVHVLALGVASSHDLDVITRMAELLHSTLAIEMDALRGLYSQFGGDPATLESVPRSPTCAAYTNHLLAVAADRSLLVTLASILPCQWGYREIGRSLKQRGMPGDQRYAAWIAEYAGDEYGDLVDWIIDRLDNLASDAGSHELGRAAEAFHLSAEYEHRFWDMAWKRESW